MFIIGILTIFIIGMIIVLKNKKTPFLFLGLSICIYSILFFWFEKYMNFFE